MLDAYMLSIDLAKQSVQVCATDRAGSVLYNRTMSRAKLERLLAEQYPCIATVGACARLATSGGGLPKRSGMRSV